MNEQLNKTNVELQRATVQLEQYAKESEKMAETRKRNRLAREIHDTLGHSLTGIITGIEACTALMDVAPDVTKLQLKAIADGVNYIIIACNDATSCNMALQEALDAGIKVIYVDAENVADFK